MNYLRRAMPAFPPLDDEQAERLIRVLRAIAYLGFFASASFLIILYVNRFKPEQYWLAQIHALILCAVFGICTVTLYLMRRGRVRVGGALQIFSLWLSLTIVPDLLGIPLHVVAANHFALAICIGPLLGWIGGLTLGVASLVFVLIQDSPLALGTGIVPLLLLTPVQIFVIEIALYGMVLSITVLIVFLSQRRSEISQVTAEALEVASYSEKKLETIIDSMADVLLVVDAGGSIVKANRAASRLLGYSEGELMGRPLRTILPEDPSDQSGVASMSQRFSVQHVSRNLRKKDGRTLPVSLSSALVTDSSGMPDGVILVAQDMTELEAVRGQLHQSNVRFNQAIAFSRIGVFEYDMQSGQFRIEDNLRSTLRSAGLESLQSYDDLMTYVEPEDRPAIAAALAEYQSGGKPLIDVEFRVNTERGPRWIMVRGAKQDESGPNLIGTFMDVTRRKRAELELARRDDVLRAVTASSEAFLQSTNWEEHVPTLLRELGAAARVSRVYIFKNHTDDISGRPVWSQLYEWAAPGVSAEIDNPRLQNLDYAAEGYQDWADTMAAHEPVYGIIREMDDHVREMMEPQQIKSMAVMPVFVQDEWWGQIGFDDCVTERVWSESELDALQLAADSLGAAIYRQRVERDLRENRDFLMTIMQNLGQGVSVVDGEGRLLFVNPSFADYTGIPAERLLGHKIDEFVEPAYDGELEEQALMRAQGKTTAYPQRIVHVDGSTTEVFVKSVPRYVDGRPDGAYAVGTNITEQQRLEENRVQLSFEREQMRIMADFVRDASHDFRTPLSIIQTSLYLLKRKAESPEQLERLNTIGTQASRLSRLIDGLLTMLELDKAELTLIPISLQTVLQNAIDRSREAAHKAGLSLDLVTPDENVFVNGEEGYLLKAVANLIDNAIAFNSEGGRVTVELHANEEQADVSVTDTGIGIAPEEQQRIFERLYKVDKARTIDSGGLGMGLSIAKRIVELHGGSVDVKSTPGEGSTFTLTFARTKQQSARQRLHSASPITEDVKM